MAVISSRSMANVEPVGTIPAAADGGLIDELVEIGMLYDKLSVFLCHLGRGDMYVGCLAEEVLRASGTTDGTVQLSAAVTAGNDDATVAASQGLEDRQAERPQVFYFFLAGRVGDAAADSCARKGHLAKREMLREHYCLCVFHSICCFVSFTVAKVL